MPCPATALSRRHWLQGSSLSLAAAWLAGGPQAMAQAPGQTALGDKITRLVSGFPAGAGMDPIVRQLADKLRGVYASTVIVENKTGAGGRLAAEAVKNAPADGSSLLFTPASPFTIFPHIYKKLAYDPQRDFAPVSTVFTTKLGLVAGPGAPVKTVAEYLAWARQNERNASYGSMGAGTMPHFLGSMFERASGARMTHVPYKGSAGVWQDLLGGQLPVAFTPIGFDSMTRHKAGAARILAIADPVRSPQLPDVPTFAELGYKALQVQEWFGVFVPAKTPPEQTAAANKALHAALAHPEVLALLERSLAEPLLSTPAELAARVKADTALWAGIVKASGFTPED